MIFTKYLSVEKRKKINPRFESADQNLVITYLKHLFKKSSRRCFTHLLFYVPKILSNGFCSQKSKIALCFT